MSNCTATTTTIRPNKQSFQSNVMGGILQGDTHSRSQSGGESWAMDASQSVANEMECYPKIQNTKLSAQKPKQQIAPRLESQINAKLRVQNDLSPKSTNKYFLQNNKREAATQSTLLQPAQQ